jgi:hypothetical protein
MLRIRRNHDRLLRRREPRKLPMILGGVLLVMIAALTILLVVLALANPF